MSAPILPTEQQLRAAKLLIVDDEQTYVSAVDYMLRQARFRHLRGVTDSARACEEFQRFKPDLVLLDLHMPVMDGFAVIEKIRQMSVDDEFLPVLAMTGYNSADSRSRALAAGATDFLGKPFDKTEVTLRVRNLLQTRFLYKQALELQSRLDATASPAAAVPEANGSH